MEADKVRDRGVSALFDADFKRLARKIEVDHQDPEIRVILDTGVEVRGKILNVSRVGMHVRVPVRFADRTVLTFRLHDCTSKGQVLYCRPDGDEFFMGLSTSGERRSEPRFSTNELIMLSVISEDKSCRTVRGRLVDVSRSGIGVVTATSVAIGTLVEVRADGRVLYGEVRNCTEIQRSEFRIGIFVEDTFVRDLREGHLSPMHESVGVRAIGMLKRLMKRLGRHRGS